MKLVNLAGNAVRTGEEYWDFRGEMKFRITRIQPPHKTGSTGRVYCQNALDAKDTHEYEFFPGVLGLTWVENSAQ